MRKRIFLLGILSLGLLSKCFTQEYNIAFEITNTSDDAIVDAVVMIDGESVLYSNYDGYAYYKTSGNDIHVDISHISYRRYERTLTITSDTLIKVTLDDLLLEEISISANSIKNNEQNFSLVDIARVLDKTGVTGEPDPIKNLTLEPGIATNSEGSVNFSVRGGDFYQNAVVIDKALVYNLSHLFGLISTMNSGVIHDVKVYKNHIPARFGNALSSVVDIKIKKGNNDKLKHKIGVGLTNMGYTLDGPLVKDKMHISLGLRAAYLGILTSPFYFDYEYGNGKNYTNYNLMDANVKLSYKISDSDKISFYFFNSSDGLLNKSRVPNVFTTKLNYSWFNTIYNFNYTKSLNSGWYINSSLNKSTYKSIYASKLESAANTNESNAFRRESIYGNYSMLLDLSKYYNNFVYRVGIKNQYTTYHPIRFETKRSSKRSFKLNMLSLYTDNDVELGNRLSLNLGLRYNLYFQNDLLRTAIDPRVALKYQHEDLGSFMLSWNKTSQNRVQLPIVNFGLPVDVWVPLSQKVKPPKTNMLSLTYKKNGLWEDFDLYSSVYVKTFRDLSTSRFVTPLLLEFSDQYEDYLTVDGKGTAYGLETSIRYQSGRWETSANYTLSSSVRQFEGINNALIFPFDYDRLHDIGINLNYRLSKRWKCNVHWMFQSGRPTSIPTSYINTGKQRDILIYNLKNNGRLPVYHRGDISFARKKELSRGRSSEWIFSLYNFYWKRNAYSYKSRLDASGKLQLHDLTVFPIIPSVFYRYSF